MRRWLSFIIVLLAVSVFGYAPKPDVISSHSLLHPSGQFTTNASVWFTNNVAGNRVSLSFNGGGYPVERLWLRPDGTTNRSQLWTWDSLGRLSEVRESNEDEDGFYWFATYDGLGRRIHTWYSRVKGGNYYLPYSVSSHAFDPQVEFLELRVAYEGQTTWKVYGPDVNGVYGGMNGVGGLDAVIDGNNYQPVISDALGNVLGVVTNGVVAWSDARPTGYGAVPGHRPLPLWHGGNVVTASAWKGRWADVTGLINLGARYYDPESGRFLSPDPVWNGRDPNYYTFAGGDPINYFDADGRITKGALQGRESTWNGNGIPDGSSGAFDAGYWIGRSAAQVGQTISRTADSAWNLFWGATSQENVAQAFASSEMASPMRNWFNAYPDTAASRLWVDQFTSEIAPAAQQMIMAYAARPGVQPVAVNVPQPNYYAPRTGFYVTPEGVAVPSTGYRAISGSSVTEARGGIIESRNPSYITFNDITAMPGNAVQNLLQIPRTPTHVATFDTLQIIRDLRTPTENWNRGNIPEPFAVSNPQWGTGGGSQAITFSPIQGFYLAPLTGINAPPQTVTVTMPNRR